LKAMVEQANEATLEAGGSTSRASLKARLAAGITAGTIGSILMLGFMMTYSGVTGAGLIMPLKALGAFVYGVEALVAGPGAMVVGALIQFGCLIVLGMLFALFISRGTSTVTALFGGIVIGIAVWVAMDLFVLPLMNPTMAARIALIPLAYFLAHVLYGFGLATTSTFIRTIAQEGHYRGSVRAAQTQPLRVRDAL
jgi:hypothetical protein